MRLALKIRITQMFGSQREFCRAFGKSDVWISNIISERNEPTLEEYYDISHALEINNLHDYLDCAEKLLDFESPDCGVNAPKDNARSIYASMLIAIRFGMIRFNETKRRNLKYEPGCYRKFMADF